MKWLRNLLASLRFHFLNWLSNWMPNWMSRWLFLRRYRKRMSPWLAFARDNAVRISDGCTYRWGIDKGGMSFTRPVRMAISTGCVKVVPRKVHGEQAKCVIIDEFADLSDEHGREHV